MEISDTLLDERFAQNPLVRGDPYVRIYAVWLIVTSGDAPGTWCELDREARISVPKNARCSQRWNVPAARRSSD